jgi:hypothetical protein
MAPNQGNILILLRMLSELESVKYKILCSNLILENIDNCYTVSLLI